MAEIGCYKAIILGIIICLLSFVLQLRWEQAAQKVYAVSRSSCHRHLNQASGIK